MKNISSDAVSLVEEVTDDAAEELPELLSASASAFSFATRSSKSVDQKVYRSMIGSLFYLCASRPDIMLSVYMSVRFQADPKEVHLRAVKIS